MMGDGWCVVSIGCLEANALWGEKSPVRTGHATTTLIESGGAKILVDPGLPGAAIGARLSERRGISLGDITHVFLTSFQLDTVRGLPALDGARWLVSEMEKETRLDELHAMERQAAERDADDVAKRAGEMIGLLEKCEAAPDRIVEGVDLFPCGGVTAGLCGLLLPEEGRTVVIAGDSVASRAHVREGRVVEWAADVGGAKESLGEVMEIADVVVPGRDNYFSIRR